MTRIIAVVATLVLLLAACGPGDVEPAEIASAVPGVSTSEAATLAPLVETAQAVLEPSEVATLGALVETEQAVVEPSEAATIGALVETAAAVVAETATPTGAGPDVTIREILSAQRDYIGCTVTVVGQVVSDAGANAFILVPAGMAVDATATAETATTAAGAMETMTAEMETATATGTTATVDETATDEAMETATATDEAMETATATDEAVGTATATDEAVGTATATDEAMETATALPCPAGTAAETATATDETATATDELMETATATAGATETATAGDNQLLVVAPRNMSAATLSGMAQVTGLVWEFDLQQIEQSSNVDLEDQLSERFNGQPVLIASQIESMDPTGGETTTAEAMETATVEVTETATSEETETATASTP